MLSIFFFVRIKDDHRGSQELMGEKSITHLNKLEEEGSDIWIGRRLKEAGRGGVSSFSNAMYTYSYFFTHTLTLYDVVYKIIIN